MAADQINGLGGLAAGFGKDDGQFPFSLVEGARPQALLTEPVALRTIAGLHPDGFERARRDFDAHFLVL